MMIMIMIVIGVIIVIVSYESDLNFLILDNECLIEWRFNHIHDWTWVELNLVNCIVSLNNRK